MKLQAKQWPLFNSEIDVHIGTILSQPFIAMETIYDATKEDSDQSGKGGGARKLEFPELLVEGGAGEPQRCAWSCC